MSCLILQAKPEDTQDLSRIINDDLAGTVHKHPRRFVGLGTLPMQAPELGNQANNMCSNIWWNHLVQFC